LDNGYTLGRTKDNHILLIYNTRQMVRVVAKFSVKADSIDAFLGLAKELVEKTVKETGCVSYEMVQDDKNPGKLFMLEQWQSKEALDKHLSSAHFTTLVPQMGKYTASEAEINVCHKVL
jgi:quinol monooxygenase YgiN